MSNKLLLHATAVAIEGEAVLLRGPPGAGKSDLALRLIDAGGSLVADDQTLLWRAADRVLAGAPPVIAGLFEVRGVGIVRMPSSDAAPVFLIAELIASGTVERMPEPRCESLLGVAVPLIALAAFEASAAAKLRLLRRALAPGALPAIITP
jgi:HPr kinase/phosphorylase